MCCHITVVRAEVPEPASEVRGIEASAERIRYDRGILMLLDADSREQVALSELPFGEVRPEGRVDSNPVDARPALRPSKLHVVGVLAGYVEPASGEREIRPAEGVHLPGANSGMKQDERRDLLPAPRHCKHRRIESGKSRRVEVVLRLRVGPSDRDLSGGIFLDQPVFHRSVEDLAQALVDLVDLLAEPARRPRLVVSHMDHRRGEATQLRVREQLDDMAHIKCFPLRRARGPIRPLSQL